MNEHIINIIKAEYKQYGLYDVKIKKSVSKGSNLLVYLDVSLRRDGSSSHGYSKRIFYDFLSSRDIENSLNYYFFDTKREFHEKTELMSENNIIVIGSIELKRYKKDGHFVRWCPSFLNSKSKFSTNFKKFIAESVKSIGVSETIKELSSIKELKISRASIYSILSCN